MTFFRWRVDWSIIRERFHLFYDVISNESAGLKLGELEFIFQRVVGVGKFSEYFITKNKFI